jgi:hypothetical protein
MDHTQADATTMATSTRSCRSARRGSHIHRWSQPPELAAAPLRVVGVEWVVDQFVNIVGGPAPTGVLPGLFMKCLPQARRHPFIGVRPDLARVIGR